VIDQQYLDQLMISGDWLSDGLKKFVLEHIPAEETLTGEQASEKLRVAGFSVALREIVNNDTVIRHDLTIGQKIEIWVDNISPVAGDWFLDTVNNDGVVYQSRWWILRMRENPEAPAEVLQKIGETLGAQVTVPLPERILQMPIPSWYYHGILGTGHCRSGSTWVFVSEAQSLLDDFVSEIQKLFQ